jgi:dipeptidyl aminopeptidase/acylaminoacyl peptidase
MGDLSGGFTEDKPVELGQRLYLRTTDYGTGRTGLSILEPRGETPKPVLWDEALLSFSKARDADVRVVMRMPAVQSSNYYLLDDSWQPVKALTDANPLEREVRMPDGPRYLTYRTSHGDVLHAALYLPAGYVEGRSYPTIVSVYERQVSMMYGIASPGSEPCRWLLQGYALLMPDIQARVNDAGKAAVESVTAAVDAAVATGAVDRERLGLMGHSNGGFETFFIATQSNLFKAAVPQAGWSNMLSSYGGVYERDGSPVSYISENEQPYIAGPWWEHWDAFIRNSPLFHAKNVHTPLLIAHGNGDKLVPFSQSVEMFNTLRRMGNTQVVLLEYDGIDHSFHVGGETEHDLEMRMREFFGHFLKGEPAPLWWTQGVSHTKGQAPPPAGARDK